MITELNNHGSTWKWDDFCVFDIGTSVCAAFPNAARDLEQDRLNAALDEAKFGRLGAVGPGEQFVPWNGIILTGKFIFQPSIFSNYD